MAGKEIVLILVLGVTVPNDGRRASFPNDCASSCDAFPDNGSWFPNADAMATPDRSAYDGPVSRFVLLLLLYVV